MFVSIFFFDFKDYVVLYQRVFYCWVCVEIICVGYVFEGGQVSIEVFISFLIVLVEFEVFVCFVYVIGEVFVKFNDYCVDFV